MIISIILGTSREARHSVKVARFIETRLKERPVSVNYIDVLDCVVAPQTGGAVSVETKNLIEEQVNKSDAYIIVSPEYNRGYPGELKLFLDSFYLEYTAKPVGFAGVSSGHTGGARAVEQLKLVALGANLIPVRENLYFPLVQDFFDDDGQPKNKEIFSQTENFLDELLLYASSLLLLREELAKRN